MARVWNTQRVERPGFVPRLVRSLGGLAILAGAFLINAFVAGVASTQQQTGLKLALLCGLGLLNVAFYFAAFCTLTPRFERRRQLLPGAIVAAIGFTLLTTIGTSLVEHQLRNSGNTYGSFAAVIGIVSYLLLLATLTLYAAELNPVLAKHLWPRALPRTEPTPADNTVLRDRAQEERRRPDQHIGVGFEPDAAEEAAADARADAPPGLDADAALPRARK
jgi:uncharacterized BrkB/YihY/UPF0761 family membrane protein